MASPRPSSPHPLTRWRPAIAAIAVLVLVIVAAATGGSDKSPSNANNVAATTSPTDDTGFLVAMTVPPSTLPPNAAPTTTIVKTSLSSAVGPGMNGANVTQIQKRLAALGFAVGAIDGTFGDLTEQAVWAFQTMFMDVAAASVSNTVDNDMWQHMQDPIAVAPRRPGAGTHVEIYLPQQAAVVFTDNAPTLVIHISSGTGETWCDTVKVDTDARGNVVDPPQMKDVCGVSTTPGGVFKFTREVTGRRDGPLGGMYNPVYFNYGIAMHGAQMVPKTPASHGCIRMNMTISNSFQSFVHLKDLVYVWGQDGKEPEQYTQQQSLPVFNYPNPDATTTTASTTTTMAPTTTVPTTTTTTVKTTTTTIKTAPSTTVKTPSPATTTAPAPPSATTTTEPPSTNAGTP